MLRRVAMVLRRLLLVVGVILLIWLPISFAYVLLLTLPRWFPAPIVMVRNGDQEVWAFEPTMHPYDVFISWERDVDVRTLREQWRQSLWPVYSDLGGPTEFILYLPLWLPAAVCLAWPVTSFVVRRRRRGRGFEVETKAASDPVTVSGS